MREGENPQQTFETLVYRYISIYVELSYGEHDKTISMTTFKYIYILCKLVIINDQCIGCRKAWGSNRDVGTNKSI